MYVCSCFGITEQQVKEHADAGACTPRQIASACKAGTDCGGCVRRIQAMLGRGACAPREMLERKLTPGGVPEQPLAPGMPSDADPGRAPGIAPGRAPGIRLPDAA
ncbi:MULTISPECIES: (2Fe-2S)-binding protein [unclassified Streptomyces]|uniref:(2Fe-2S)-binding protein n=1 Tax=unclassified Streptomyces TaxID=2593676 RepID=UPI002E812564|nr:(2Fe-2S)-binding protein [Streptomyces sp. NBC_00562]WTC82395.1 (2Fe-2S)-binding protein [Streptomyces sp. NBC_01653]WTD88471.1 (2Fe-2S)-binding protein [Streptomyces sp. NBC_01637]WUC19502.1 (2Fe-2S)-binding protein [Streptomyces sp. NBC_00562]